MSTSCSAKRRRVVLWLGVAFTFATIGGCASAQTKGDAHTDASRPPLYEKEGRLYVSWTEEVQLSDGRVIVAERSDEYRKVSDPGRGWGSVGWLYQRGSFKATLPAPVSKTVSWEGTLQPLVLDVLSDKQTYFVGAIAANVARDEWKIPDDHRYVVFRLAGQSWERIGLDKLPSDAKPTFLARTRDFFSRSKSLSPGSMVSLAQKLNLDSDPSLSKELRQIIRP